MGEEKIFISPQMVEFIRKKRKELSLSAYELSEACGMNKYWVNNIENGRTKTITRENALKIYNALDMIEHEFSTKDFLQKIEAGIITADIIEDQGIHIDEVSSDENYVFDAAQHKKALKKKINVAHNKMLNMLEKIDFNDAKSIRKYEPYINAYTAMLTSFNGQEFFKRVFKFPLHFLGDDDIDRIVEIIEKNSICKYDIEYDSQGNPYLVTKTPFDPDEEDIFR